MNNFYTNPYGNYPQYNNAVVAQQMPQQTVRNGINWVNGEEGARAFQIAPNSNVMLLDAENEGMFYIKSADNIGMSTLRIFKYKEIVDTQPVNTPQMANAPVEYATRQEVQELRDMISSLTYQHRGGGRNEQSIQSAQYRAKNNAGSAEPRE